MHNRHFCPADSRRQLVLRIRKLLWAVCLVSVGCGKSEQAGGTSDPPALAAAQFTYPTAGSVIDPFRHFKWTKVNGAVGYYFQIGSTPGGDDIFNVGNLPPNITEWAVDN